MLKEFGDKMLSNFRFPPPLNILDLGCGKGGDLKKWKNQKVGFYVGVDISGESLKHALERYK